MMNELYCANKIMEYLGSISSWLRIIDEDFLIPVWIIAIAIALTSLTIVVYGVFTMVMAIKSWKMMYSNLYDEPKKDDIKKIIRKAQRRARHRKEEMEYETEEEI